jgi:hypothetical protein
MDRVEYTANMTRVFSFIERNQVQNPSQKEAKSSCEAEQNRERWIFDII